MEIGINAKYIFMFSYPDPILDHMRLQPRTYICTLQWLSLGKNDTTVSSQASFFFKYIVNSK